jgi:hypothetical protein
MEATMGERRRPATKYTPEEILRAIEENLLNVTPVLGDPRHRHLDVHGEDGSWIWSVGPMVDGRQNHVVWGTSVVDGVAAWLSVYGPGPTHGMVVDGGVSSVLDRGLGTGRILRIGRFWAVVGFPGRTPGASQLADLKPAAADVAPEEYDAAELAKIEELARHLDEQGWR